MTTETETSKYDGHTPEPWMVRTSNSWRRIGTVLGPVVCEPVIQRHDNHPDLYFPNGGEDGPDARLMVDAPQILRERDEARAALELYRDCSRLGEQARGGNIPKPDCDVYTRWLGEWDGYQPPEMRYEQLCRLSHELRDAAISGQPGDNA